MQICAEGIRGKTDACLVCSLLCKRVRACVCVCLCVRVAHTLCSLPFVRELKGRYESVKRKTNYPCCFFDILHDFWRAAEGAVTAPLHGHVKSSFLQNGNDSGFCFARVEGDRATHRSVVLWSASPYWRVAKKSLYRRIIINSCWIAGPHYRYKYCKLVNAWWVSGKFLVSFW